MEFYAYKRLSPSLKTAIFDFLGKREADRFLLKSPGVKAIGNLPAHYVVLEQYKDYAVGPDNATKKSAPMILAYGEAVFLDENNELDLEICIKDSGDLASETLLQGAKEGSCSAYEMLLSGIVKMAEQEDIIVVARSGLPDDETLLKAGFKLYDSDYLMEYSGISENAGHKLEFELNQKTEVHTNCTDVVFKKEQIGEVVLFSLISADSKTRFASCEIYEYSSSVCITNVFTEEEFRRKGFGTELIKRIIKEYGEKHRNIVLHVSGANEKAISLYKKLGFLVKESLFTYKTI